MTATRETLARPSSLSNAATAQYQQSRRLA